MKAILKPTVVVLVIALSILLSLSAFQLPKTVPSDAPADVFSSSRAMVHVQKITENIHPMGTPENYKVRDYIVQELEKLGLKPEIQKAYVENNMWGDVVSGNVENISALLEGANKESGLILMVSHYDSTPGGPGAADDASAVAALLETLRALKASAALSNNIVFLFTDGEEVGLLGSKAFVDKNPMLKNTDMVINLEARGNTGPVIMFETADENGWFIEEFKKAVPHPVAYSFAYDIYKNMPNNTDFTMFKNAGKPGFNFASIVGYETYHNKYDNAENLNQGTLQHQGTYALSLARHFGNLPLKDRERSNSVYFTLASSVLVLYSEWWAIPLAALAVILFAAVIIMAIRKKSFSFKWTAAGFGISLLLTAASAGVGLGGQKIFDSLYVKNGGNMTTDEIVALLKDSNPWMLALVLLTTLIIWGAYCLLHKKAVFQHMLYGALFLWIILTVASSLIFKGVSYVFVWPVILASAGLLSQNLFKSERMKGFGYSILFVLTAASCILIFLPVGYLLFQSMTIMMAVALTGLLSLPLTISILSALLFMEKNSNAEVDAEKKTVKAALL